MILLFASFNPGCEEIRHRQFSSFEFYVVRKQERTQLLLIRIVLSKIKIIEEKRFHDYNELSPHYMRENQNVSNL